MIERLFTQCLARPADVAPSREDLEVVGVFNPGAAPWGDGSDDVALLARIAERPREKREGYLALPRYDIEADEITIDWAPLDSLELFDPRVVRVKATGQLRLTFVSHLRFMRLTDGRKLAEPDLVRVYPAQPGEEYGIEDPRLTPLEGRCAITYVAVSHHGVATALAETTDFRRFERRGAIFCPENKDVVLFPDRIGGQYIAVHRPNPHQHFTPPEMWLARSPDLEHWGAHAFFYSGGAGAWDAGRIGAGPPPVRIDEGYLLVYHGMSSPLDSPDLGVYAAGALLLDAQDPSRILKRTPEPFFVPTEDFESTGFVSAVVFPTGIVRRGDEVLLYYGAADESTGVVGFAVSDILSAME